MRSFTIATLLLAAVPVAAQAPVSAPSAANLAKARRLFGLMHLDRMMQASVQGAMRNMQGQVTGSVLKSLPGGTDALRKDPTLMPKLNRMEQVMGQEMVATMPAMLSTMTQSMTVAYARQLTPAELDGAIAYYSSPAGQGLLNKVPQIMADPAVVSAQQQLMRDLAARMPAIMAKAKAAAGLPGPVR